MHQADGQRIENDGKKLWTTRKKKELEKAKKKLK